MKWFIIKIGLSLMIALAICELHTIIYKIKPSTKEVILNNVYLEKSYNQPIKLLYFLYELTPYFKDLIWAIVAYFMAKRISFRLSQIMVIFVFYYIFQVLFYVWDRNTSFLRNYVVYTTMALIMLQIALPENKKGIIISIE